MDIWANELIHSILCAIKNAQCFMRTEDSHDLAIAMHFDTYSRLVAALASSMIMSNNSDCQMIRIYGVPIEIDETVEPGRAILIHKEKIYGYIPSTENMWEN